VRDLEIPEFHHQLRPAGIPRPRMASAHGDGGWTRKLFERAIPHIGLLHRVGTEKLIEHKDLFAGFALILDRLDIARAAIGI